MATVKKKTKPTSKKTNGSLIDAWLHESLFHSVPSAIAIIDAEWNVVRANQAFEKRFGEWRGRRCYEVYKGRKRKCPRCMASRVFSDGKMRTRLETGLDLRGDTVYYMVYMVPIVEEDGSVPLIVEMSTDVTRQTELSDKLERANSLNRSLIKASSNAIVAIDPGNHITLWNPAATELFGWEPSEVMHRMVPKSIMPPQFDGSVRRGEKECEVTETEVTDKNGEKVPVRFFGVALNPEDDLLGSAAFFEDLREYRQLEREKMDAERLATVGETVAGLAHGVKNILTGLEGGLYLMQTGLDKGKDERVREGFGMLSRNIGRVTSFVRTLLDFSKGGIPKAQLINPVTIAEDVIFLYREAAAREGIDVAVEPAGNVGMASFDPEGLHTCLANLITNAIDACRMSEKPKRCVRIRVYERADKLLERRSSKEPRTEVVFEVADDGVGMDYEVKQKVFTNFFTTKSEGGTGLGLLLTRKIVYEHGGSLEIDSVPHKGTVFRLIFPRRRLPILDDKENETT